MSKFQYEFHGETLSLEDIAPIVEFYQAACTAEFMMENYPNYAFDEESALSLGYSVRGTMNKFDISETAAIDVIIEDLERMENENQIINKISD